MDFKVLVWKGGPTFSFFRETAHTPGGTTIRGCCGRTARHLCAQPHRASEVCFAGLAVSQEDAGIITVVTRTTERRGRGCV